MNRDSLVAPLALVGGGAIVGVVADRAIAEGPDSTTLLTAVLVIITAYYAWQNRRVVGEMQRATELAASPSVVLRPQILVPGKYVMVRAVNVGGGPAIGLRVEVSFHPPTGVSPSLPSYEWDAPVLAAGEHADLYARASPNSQMLTVSDLTAACDEVSIVGRCTDVLGKTHKINSRLALSEWWSVIQQAGQRFEQPLGRRLEQIVKELGNIAQALKP